MHSSGGQKKERSRFSADGTVFSPWCQNVTDICVVSATHLGISNNPNTQNKDLRQEKSEALLIISGGWQQRRRNIVNSQRFIQSSLAPFSAFASQIIQEKTIGVQTRPSYFSDNIFVLRFHIAPRPLTRPRNQATSKRIQLTPKGAFRKRICRQEEWKDQNDPQQVPN